MNMVLKDAVERRVSPDEPGSEEPQDSLVVLRGDTVAAVCQLDELADAAVSWEDARGEAIPAVVH